MSVFSDSKAALRASVPLPEPLGGTTFVSGIGRVYRLFGNEEESLSPSAIPAIPPMLAPTKRPTLSLEEALQQIESYSTPTSSTLAVCEPVPLPLEDSPVLQLFPVTGESAIPVPPQIDEASSRTASPQPHATLSVKDIVNEVSQHLPNPNEERRKPFRVIFEYAEEPFIVPFTKPEPLPKVPLPEVIEPKNVRALRVVTEAEPQVLLPKKFPKRWHSRRKTNPPYRKQFLLPPVADAPTEEPMVNEVPKPVIDVSTFQWSAPLDSLMQTADNQTRMLTDHLVVQSNQGVKTICFKSVFPGDGCSTILLCAVRALLERKHRVLLIDAHDRHINLPAQLNLAGNLDSGNVAIALNEYFGFWVWQESKTVEENMTLLAEVISAHREEYDLILLDCGSLTESPLQEFVDFWNRIEADGIILVSNMKHPPEISMSHIAGRLRQHHIHLIGITENYV
jgi:Mrp family chromosome partitioning ATPase